RRNAPPIELLYPVEPQKDEHPCAEAELEQRMEVSATGKEKRRTPREQRRASNTRDVRAADVTASGSVSTDGVHVASGRSTEGTAGHERRGGVRVKRIK